MPLVAWMLTACWSPGDWTPPPPPPEAVEALAEIPPEPEEPEPAEEPEDPEPAEPEAPFERWKGLIRKKPATLVSDLGEPVAFVIAPDTPVEVRALEDVRARVWCETCRPAAEGWIQRDLVERAP